jgi:hypothetical protein
VAVVQTRAERHVQLALDDCAKGELLQRARAADDARVFCEDVLLEAHDAHALVWCVAAAPVGVELGKERRQEEELLKVSAARTPRESKVRPFNQGRSARSLSVTVDARCEGADGAPQSIPLVHVVDHHNLRGAVQQRIRLVDRLALGECVGNRLADELDAPLDRLPHQRTERVVQQIGQRCRRLKQLAVIDTLTAEEHRVVLVRDRLEHSDLHCGVHAMYECDGGALVEHVCELLAPVKRCVQLVGERSVGRVDEPPRGKVRRLGEQVLLLLAPAGVVLQRRHHRVQPVGQLTFDAWCAAARRVRRARRGLTVVSSGTRAKPGRVGRSLARQVADLARRHELAAEFLVDRDLRKRVG